MARRTAGYSLAELLVALGLLGLVMAATAMLLQSGLAAWGWGAGRVEAQQSARVALERMARELKEAGYDPTGAGFKVLLVAEPTRVVFQRDLNGNGVIDPTRERVTYLLRSGETTLRRDAGGGAQPIAEGVRRLALSYLDREGAATTDLGQVVSVRIELETGRARAEAIMATVVTLRNVPVW
ncbi:MAG TPA: prepilin-type N-terminal cleavage/methylation domain-containing protein [Methylomirabilota bacterium]|jgi:type II secretory pathway component PulJ|nr:prepilin-type N-terminal cleavage/methylation domain-containing protein [Methylomirabilota bacterium]